MFQKFLHLLLMFLLIASMLLISSCSNSTISTPIKTITIPNVTHTLNITPRPGSILTDSQGEPSNICMESVEFDTGSAEKDYAGSDVKTGDPIFILRGEVQNQNNEHKYIAMYAQGYGFNSDLVCNTLDASFIVGQILLDLEPDQTSGFTLHLNPSHDLLCIYIYANIYDNPPP